MSIQTFGDVGRDGYLFNNASSAVGGDPLVAIFPGADKFSLIGFQFNAKSAALVRTPLVTATDAVVASTHTWTFANGAFTAADVGGTITVAGATNVANNGTFTITSVTNATTIVTSGSQTNETFTAGGPTVTLSVSSAALTGSFTVDESLDYSDGGLNKIATAGNWADITGLLLPTTGAVALGSSAIYRELHLFAGHAIRVTFTPTAGAGAVSALFFAKTTG